MLWTLAPLSSDCRGEKVLPAYTLIRFSDVHLEDRTKPSGDDIQTLLSVQSTYIRLCKMVQTLLLHWSGDNYTLNTSALDKMIVSN